MSKKLTSAQINSALENAYLELSALSGDEFNAELERAGDDPLTKALLYAGADTVFYAPSLISAQASLPSISYKTAPGTQFNIETTPSLNVSGATAVRYNGLGSFDIRTLLEEQSSDSNETYYVQDRKAA